MKFSCRNRDRFLKLAVGPAKQEFSIREFHRKSLTWRPVSSVGSGQILQHILVHLHSIDRWKWIACHQCCDLIRKSVDFRNRGGCYCITSQRGCRGQLNKHSKKKSHECFHRARLLDALSLRLPIGQNHRNPVE